MRVDTEGHTDKEEESNLMGEYSAEKGRVQMLRDRAGTKVSTPVTCINLCIDREDDVLVCRTGPGEHTRNTAVCGGGGEGDGEEDRGISTGGVEDKDDIAPCTNQSDIHSQKTMMLKKTDTTYSVLASRSRTIDGTRQEIVTPEAAWQRLYKS